MRKNLLILISVLLCAAMLTACGSAGQTAAAESGTRKNDAPAASAAQEGTVWQPQFIAIESDTAAAKLQNGSLAGAAMLFTSSGVLADETPEGVTPAWPEQYWVYGPTLVQVDLDGKTRTIPYVPERDGEAGEGNSGVLFEQSCADPDGSLWVLENHYRTGEKTEEQKALVHLGEDGTVLRKISLQELALHREETANQEGEYSFTVSGMAADEQGQLCLAIHEWFAGNGSYVQDNRICVLDRDDGAVKQTISLDGEVAGLVRLGDGRIVTASYQGAYPVFSLVNTREGSVDEIAVLDDFLDCMFSSGEDQMVWYGAGDSLYRLNADTAEMEKILDWTACGVAHSSGDSVFALGDGRVATVAASGSGGSQELVILTPVDASALPERKVLRMAVTNLYPFTTEMVSRFNRSNTEYVIEVTDYSQFNDYSSGNPEDWNAGITRLQTELIAGNVPDILDISLLPVSRLEEKGLLVDLLPYLDSDPELSLSQLNAHVLDAFAQNGKLYQTVGNYYVLTTAGLSDVVGSRMGWTMDDFSAAMAKLQAEHPESTVFDLYTTRDDALTFLLYLEMENYVDWSTGNCAFDSEGFRQLLQFVKGFPTTYDWGADVVTPMDLDEDSRLLMGLQLMKQCSFASFEDVQRNTAGLAGAPCTFVGYPTENGVGSMFSQIGNSFAISSACEDKEAAWQFVRQFFLPVYQEQFKGYAFPTNLSVYEEMKQEAMSVRYQRNPDGSYLLDQDGNRVEEDRGSVDAGGVKISLQAVSPEEIARVEEIIAATDHILSTDNSLKEIIVSGAAGFFADQRSVEEVTKQIQSRASLYVNEQR